MVDSKDVFHDEVAGLIEYHEESFEGIEVGVELGCR